MKMTWLWLFLLVLTFASPALCESRAKFPSPPAPMQPLPTSKPKVNKVMRVDTVRLQREAKELSDLAQSVPVDVDSVSRGMLPKDLSDKLKRIEKLSKQLRGEISH